MKFDERQVNNLLTGVVLVCELPTTVNNRRFITVRSFNSNLHGNLLCWDKTIKSYNDGYRAIFEIHVYTVPVEYIEKDYDINEESLIENSYIENIIGWEQLYANLSIYVKELQKFVPQWHCDNPLE